MPAVTTCSFASVLSFIPYCSLAHERASLLTSSSDSPHAASGKVARGTVQSILKLYGNSRLLVAAERLELLRDR